MTMENPNTNPENTINTFEDIRKVLTNLPEDETTLSKFTREIKEMAGKRGHTVSEADIQTLIYEIEVMNKDSAQLNAGQKYFLEQASDSLTDYLDSILEE